MKEIHPTVDEDMRPEEGRLVRPHDESPFPMLKWATFHYGWIVVVLALLGAFVATQVPAVTGTTTYEAEALVTARDLVIEPEQLPQTASAIFSAGEVARTTIELSGVDLQPNDLIPDHVRLEPVEGTVVVRVVGTHQNPETAAAMANGAARGLVMELQRLGTGVGRFSLHTPAVVPTERSEGPPLPPLAMGLLAGGLFGLGIVGLVLVARRPVIGPHSLGSSLGVPVTGSIALSSIDASGELRFVPHLAKVTSALFPKGDERRYLVGVHVRRRALRLLGIVLVRTLSRSRKAALVGPGSTHHPFGTEDERNALLVSESSAPGAGIPTVVIGRFLTGESIEDPRDGWVLVVGKGAPLHEVRRAVDELDDHPLVGVIFLRPLGVRDMVRRQNPQVA